MRRLWGVIFAVLVVANGNAQSDARYGHTTTFSVFANYSNDSSHMFLGQEENRRIAGLGVGYARRLAHKSSFDFSYEADLLPLTFVRDPFVDGTSTVVIHGSPIVVVNPPISGPFSGPTMADCTSGTTVFNGITQNGVSFTQTVTQQCSSRWTYAGGISPMGLRFSFMTRHRLQPYLIANAGFLMSPRDLPVNNSERFNFTFEGGAGLEWFRDRGHSLTLDYRVHHLSNGYRGYYNPGIDNGVFRVGYWFGR